MASVYIRACQPNFLPHNQANDKRNLWNRTIIPQSYNQRTIISFKSAISFRLSTVDKTDLYGHRRKIVLYAKPVLKVRRIKKRHNLVLLSLTGGVVTAAMNKTPNEDRWDGQTKLGFNGTPNA